MTARTITITLHVDAGAAARARSASAGPQKMQLGDDDLAALAGVELEALARHLERAPGWGEPLHLGCEPLARADLAALRACLRVRSWTMGEAHALGLDPVAWLRGELAGRDAPWLARRKELES